MPWSILVKKSWSFIITCLKFELRFLKGFKGYLIIETSWCLILGERLVSAKTNVHVFIFTFPSFFFFFFSSAWTVNLLCRDKNYCSYIVAVLFTYCSITVHALKILKMGPAVLFTHLKIILLQCFQFSVSATISSIQTDLKNTIKESCKKIKTMTKWVIYKWRYELWGLNIFLFTYYILYNV